MLKVLLIFLISSVFVSFSSVIDERSNWPSYRSIQKREDVCQTDECKKTAQEVIDNMDENVKPCDNFYKFACGGFLKKKTIPEDKTAIHIFQVVQDELNSQIKALIDKPLTGSEPTFAKMIKNMYDSCMNLEQIEAAKGRPLIEALSSLGGWPVVVGNKWDSYSFDWINTVSKLRKLGFNHNIFSMTAVWEDMKNSSAYSITMDQARFGLPRSYLIKDLSDPALKAYYDLMVKTAVKLGANKATAEKEMREALELEQTLAKNAKPLEERRDYDKLYNKMTIQELQNLAPEINWYKYISGLFEFPISPTDKVVVYEPEYMKKLAVLMTTAYKRPIANYMMWRAVEGSLLFLSSEWRALKQEFESAVSGSSKENPRWEVCLKSFRSTLNVAFGSYYVRNYFKEESKQKALEMVNYLRKEFRKMLESVDWMEASTKQKALEKADDITPYIGYPPEILNDELINKYYENLTITPDNYFKNSLNMEKWYNDDESSYMRTTSVKGDWKKHVHVVVANAYNNALENSIDFPAGILQKGFYNKDRPFYMNFGGIGHIIGHEITHGFDDIGKQFDKDGNNINWWDKNTDKLFEEKAKCFIDQYGNQTAENGMKVNGVNTLGENIADNGGMKEAYLAYQAWVKDNGPEPKLPGLNYTPGQMYWISAANIWCSKYRPEAMKMYVLNNFHAPQEFRVNVPVSNLAEFSKEFGCAPGSPMNPDKKCKLW